MFSIRDERYNWQDFEILRLFKKHGVKRFWIDDIWDVDWEDVRKHARAWGEPGIPDVAIEAPPWVLTRALGGMDSLYRWHQARASRRRAGGGEGN